ncbi:hypothetical protein BDZ85DRAFT_46459 [Elsinoe ampelina]|uniref:Uncharacterized protein n=1 Tax=Elsinoe ampelina TaxID=302913 RepID=A0A6A6G0W5_9PEZI|nr:hypothetical protein BDZ85DRAFT_46459 [Elsinoe ampelina]
MSRGSRLSDSCDLLLIWLAPSIYLYTLAPHAGKSTAPVELRKGRVSWPRSWIQEIDIAEVVTDLSRRMVGNIPCGPCQGGAGSTRLRGNLKKDGDVRLISVDPRTWLEPLLVLTSAPVLRCRSG